MNSKRENMVQITLPDGRRGLWLLCEPPIPDEGGVFPFTSVLLCAGREGDDAEVMFKLGEVVTDKQLHDLADVALTLRFAFEQAEEDVQNRKDAASRHVEKALKVAHQYGGIDGAHHKTWVIDQMVRALCDDPETYERWVAERKAGEDGPETYEWDEGIAP